MRQHTVPSGISAVPIKQYLMRAFPALPGWLLRETLKKKDVRVNGVKQGADAVVSAGDQLAIYIDEKYFSAPLSIIYQDEDLLVVEKPAGIPVDLDGGGIGEDTMLSRIKAVCPSAELCHRLDTYTGGVLIAAKNEDTLRRMTEIFKSHQLKKFYNCIVVGRPTKPEATLKAWLEKDANTSRVRILDHPKQGALNVETRYRLIESKKGLSLLEVELITGRTHQIRAHLSHVGLPLLGDDKYGDRAMNKQMKVVQPQLWCVRLEVLGHEFRSKPHFSVHDFEA